MHLCVCLMVYTTICQLLFIIKHIFIMGDSTVQSLNFCRMKTFVNLFNKYIQRFTYNLLLYTCWTTSTAWGYRMLILGSSIYGLYWLFQWRVHSHLNRYELLQLNFLLILSYLIRHVYHLFTQNRQHWLHIYYPTGTGWNIQKIKSCL